MSSQVGREYSQEDELLQVLKEDASIDERYDPNLDKDELVHVYRSMAVTRLLDQRLVALQRQGRIGFHVGSLGEEAAIIGSAFAMRSQDWILPCYREFGATLMRGLSLQSFVDNLFGNRNDVVLGRQMPHHVTCRAGKWTSVSSPVGTQITQAVGMAWASKLRGEGAASLVYFGDGATSSADFHSGMNFAAVFKIPTIFFCRNNGWAISTPTERQTASRSIASKGTAYGVKGVRVDGNDLLAVVYATRRAIEHGLAGHGPTLIEARTYRMGGHSTSDDPNLYRERAQLGPWTARDPVERLRHYLEQRGYWTDSDEELLQKGTEQRFREAVAQAENAGPPLLESMFEDVYEKMPWHLREQRDELLRGERAPSAH